jgi:hypothetical protein
MRSRAFGTNVGEEDVGAVDELERDIATGLRPKIEHDALLRSVVELEDRVVRHVATEHPLERSRRVAGGRLDLDDVGAPVGENATGRGPGHPHADLDDANTIHRPGHDHPLSALARATFYPIFASTLDPPPALQRSSSP